MIEQKIPRLDSGLQKITRTENNLFSYRLDYSTPTPMIILGKPNRLGHNSKVTAQSRKSSRTLTALFASKVRIIMKLRLLKPQLPWFTATPAHSLSYLLHSVTWLSSGGLG